MLKHNVETGGRSRKKKNSTNRKQATPVTAEATSGSSGNDGKGSDSLDEAAYRSHTISGGEGARHKPHDSRGARSSAGSKSDEAETWIDQQRDRL